MSESRLKFKLCASCLTFASVVSFILLSLMTKYQDGGFKLRFKRAISIGNHSFESSNQSIQSTSIDQTTFWSILNSTVTTSKPGLTSNEVGKTNSTLMPFTIANTTSLTLLNNTTRNLNQDLSNSTEKLASETFDTSTNNLPPTSTRYTNTTEDSSSICQLDIVINDFCILPDALGEAIGWKTKLSDIYNIVFRNNTIEELMAHCTVGKWCLKAQSKYSDINKLLASWTNTHYTTFWCWPGFGNCIRNMVEAFYACPQKYEILDFVAVSLDMLCEATTVRENSAGEVSMSCMYEILRSIQISMADILRFQSSSDKSVNNNSCLGAKSQMSHNLLCLVERCPNIMDIIFSNPRWLPMRNDLITIEKTCFNDSDICENRPSWDTSNTSTNNLSNRSQSTTNKQTTTKSSSLPTIVQPSKSVVKLGTTETIEKQSVVTKNPETLRKSIEARTIVGVSLGSVGVLLCVITCFVIASRCGSVKMRRWYRGTFGYLPIPNDK